ncbi:hypothetical protein TPHA_0P00660 [Tetrapisispora phaffii CBS 4417]|uniref:MHD domain-containing protein n=1 Tax=Tetrapisispora phaffii (strain ATCC 24235 / CBS 4417 / NBRC 1672 / NRRL Y-8282 / UCD 70-5) TaxID=1071381 RepID=G8C246_TETPH|nr:hypothetical protein TPHA_0P00660 [Tetrapisispora phaffii CBS 4417]CCE66224.1 hypothetical protein TPHA_0P00660 [Tetrapisispora phaffii CBS 4417]
MINGVLIYSSRGDLIVCDLLKSSLKRTISDIFKIQVINSLEMKSPILTLGSTTFHHIRSSSESKLWIVAITRSNANSGVIWEFLYKLDSMLTAYDLNNEEKLMEKFMVYYEMIDVMLTSNAMPINTELSSIASKISYRLPKTISNSPTNEKNNNNGLSIPKFLTRNSRSMSQEFSNITQSDIPWRPTGIKYKKNEVFLYVNEKINILVSKDQTILKAYVDGSIDLVSHLSGTPICQFGLNDYLSMTGNNISNRGDEFRHDFMDDEDLSTGRSSSSSVKIEDCTFHQCVSLDKFNDERLINFVPPDGSFELMRYHVRDDLNIPFKVTPRVSISSSRCSMRYKIILKSLFPTSLSAADAMLKIPLPPGTVDCKINASSGKCNFSTSDNCAIWKFNKYKGLTENELILETVPSSSTDILSLQQWTRPPMSMNFEIIMFSNSGLVVKYLKVMERVQKYRPVKWIKYVSKSGSYEIRY